MSIKEYKNSKNFIDKIKKMVEMIKENQYRISLVIVSILFLGFLIYMFILANGNTRSIGDFISNPVNWVLIISGFLLYKTIRPLIKEIWRQTDIRDKIEQKELNLQEQRLEKIKLENELIRLEIEDKKKLRRKSA